MPADYDGDGRADLAVFRRGATAYYWYIRLSATGATSVREWGWTWTTSIPVPGDYDGDGMADPAYFTAFNAGWWILPSSGATQYAIDCPITVAYGTQPGTAAAGADYTAQTGTLTFVAGSATQAAQSVSVPIVPDSRDEEDETFSVTISVVTGGGVGAVSALVVTIVDDDPPPTLAISDVAVMVPFASNTTRTDPSASSA